MSKVLCGFKIRYKVRLASFLYEISMKLLQKVMSFVRASSKKILKKNFIN